METHAAPSSVPDALAEPTVPVGARWIAGVVLVNLGINAVLYAPLNVLLGLQATAIDPAAKEGMLSLVSAFGAAVALVANPLTGALSDRTTSRFGRRSPWVLGGAAVAVAALLFLASASTLTGTAALLALVVGWCCVQLGVNSAYSTIAATVPDRTPVSQRASVGGLGAMGQTVGILCGAVIGFVIGGDIGLGYGLCAAVMALSVIPYLTHRDDPVLPVAARQPFRFGAFLRGFWISPRRHPDFAWAWITRFLMFMGNQMTIVYLLFFLTDVIRHPDPAGGVLVLTGLYSVMVLLSAVAAGRMSDATGGRRRIFVAGSSGLIGVATLILAFFPVWPAAMLGAAVLGVGFGAYLAVDFALLTQVLPSASDRGKDLGVVNIAATLPQVFAPAAAWLAVTMLGGYTTMFLIAAVLCALGAVLVYRIKSVP
ncbi:MFS transporter [Zhihengliuella alba]|uniref:MFS transporter n=1 Tax=Zhihengliuella alba TaxID=547018 RepID=A0ABP7DGB3_9MICC